MTSPISGISFGMPGITDVAGVSGAASAAAPASASGDGGFAAVLTGSIDSLNAVQGTADTLALQAATGDLQDAHDYMIASTEARLATDTVVTLKNSAVAAFTEIMRMQI
ncbi:flagellar hook-basal body complex protein FliE [Modestobacter italicus]|uniref:flagellar hook-basal body complex protein FliE n=1 Tax=Modestobacter italicus (strain DSM 44449 / CECT 9708 / BC 501) TaxID=2732864 RepID=UPI001C95204B|nr:flagellar hook-basal body complex protein FliE [Modestobacter italicus]